MTASQTKIDARLMSFLFSFGTTNIVFHFCETTTSTRRSKIPCPQFKLKELEFGGGQPSDSEPEFRPFASSRISAIVLCFFDCSLVVAELKDASCRVVCVVVTYLFPCQLAPPIFFYHRRHTLHMLCNQNGLLFYSPLRGRKR